MFNCLSLLSNWLVRMTNSNNDWLVKGKRFENWDLRHQKSKKIYMFSNIIWTPLWHFIQLLKIICICWDHFHKCTFIICQRILLCRFHKRYTFYDKICLKYDTFAKQKFKEEIKYKSTCQSIDVALWLVNNKTEIYFGNVGVFHLSFWW